MIYSKLVRDKIPEIIKQKGKSFMIHTTNENEYWNKLLEKLKEETEEFIESNNEEELIDILEVIDTICSFKNINKKELEIQKKVKSLKRGSFKDRIILEKVED